MHYFRYFKEEQEEGYTIRVPHFNTTFYWPEGDTLEYAQEMISTSLGHSNFTLEEITDAD